MGPIHLGVVEYVGVLACLRLVIEPGPLAPFLSRPISSIRPYCAETGVSRYSMDQGGAPNGGRTRFTDGLGDDNWKAVDHYQKNGGVGYGGHNCGNGFVASILLP
jgi:hypothetical protein